RTIMGTIIRACTLTWGMAPEVSPTRHSAPSCSPALYVSNLCPFQVRWFRTCIRRGLLSAICNETRFKLVRTFMKITIFSLLYLFCLSHGVHAEQALSYNIVTQAKHNSASFTQGLTLDGDWLIESSGLRGKSFISIYHADSGAPKARWALPHQQFAEGLTLLNQEIYLLTWTSGVMHILDAASLKTVATKQFEGEGWGLTHDGTQFIMSDGSDKLTFRNTSDF